MYFIITKFLKTLEYPTKNSLKKKGIKKGISFNNEIPFMTLS